MNSQKSKQNDENYWKVSSNASDLCSIEISKTKKHSPLGKC